MPNTVICHYRVASGNEVSFESLLRRHWSILRSFDLVTDDPSKVFKGEETDSNNPIYFEIFEWRDGGSEKAHEVPDLVDLWEQMEGLCETRNTGPSMEFPHVEALRGY
ncbi:MAG: hypothetical protein VX225_01605 [Pseudomonadota bacterium]|nr:hypothetical protein [Pseudomonadota bacterium]